jgi:hypothetical protein
VPVILLAAFEGSLPRKLTEVEALLEACFVSSSEQSTDEVPAK